MRGLNRHLLSPHPGVSPRYILRMAMFEALSISLNGRGHTHFIEASDIVVSIKC